jgi:transposase
MVFGDKPVVLCHGVADLRRGAWGLLSLLEIYQEDVWYLFSNRTRSLVKAVRVDAQGIWLVTRRLNQGSFRWPERAGGASPLSVHSAEELCAGQRLKRVAAAFL